MKRRIDVGLAVALALFGSMKTDAQSVKQPLPVPVFVTSVGAANGFTDPNRDNQDTVKDLRDSLKGYKKELTLIDKREQAVIVLIVQNREKARTVSGRHEIAEGVDDWGALAQNGAEARSSQRRSFYDRGETRNRLRARLLF